ncbi:hypothetical protein ACEWY4_022874 [Coilia grayii]|uniref:Myb/SANT-like DNA-binding domain-containing protein n=1 Tax=Coilia grayii TaxID=363190 RepID=A0ABD1J4I9_9TELE
MARKPNFTLQELNVMVDEVEKQRLVLFSKLKNSVTNTEKKEAWQEIADCVHWGTVTGLTPLEEHVLGVLSQEAVEGVPGGIDVCAMRRMPQTPSGTWQFSPFAQSSLTVILHLTHSTQPWCVQGAIIPCTPGILSVQGQSHGHCSVCTEDPVASVLDLQCDCSEALLRSEEEISVLKGIREELAALREQNQRHRQEVMT